MIRWAFAVPAVVEGHQAFSLMPVAAGPFLPDAFTNTKYGKGITWGLCHNTWAGSRGKGHTVLMRFDCDLSPKFDDPALRETEHFWKPEVYFRSGLSETSRKLRDQATKEDLGKVIGKHGRTAQAMRTLLSSASAKIKKRTVLEIIE